MTPLRTARRAGLGGLPAPTAQQGAAPARYGAGTFGGSLPQVRARVPL